MQFNFERGFEPSLTYNRSASYVHHNSPILYSFYQITKPLGMFQLYECNNKCGSSVYFVMNYNSLMYKFYLNV